MTPQQVGERLARIESKLDAIKEDTKRDRLDHADHEGRIRLLEKWRYAFPASLLISIGSAAGLIIQGGM